MGISDYDILNMSKILAGEGNWFTARLLRLMAQADLDNLRRLAHAFPKEFVEFCMYKWNGVPYQFISVEGVKYYVNVDLLNDEPRYRWLDPATGETVNPTLTHGRDF